MKIQKWCKKIVVLVVAVTMLAGSLVGCKGKEVDTTKDSAKSEETESNNEENVSKEREKLTIALQSNQYVTDYDDNYFTKMLEDALNVDLEFYMLPQDGTEVKTKVSLMVTSGSDMPDVICTDSLSPEMILDYGSKGALIPLNDYVNDPTKAVNFNAIPEEDREIMLSAMTSADMNMYGLPKYEPETWNLTPNRMFVNEAWLKKLELDVPTTTDEYYDMLVAFRDKDPNGNGIQDEIGVYGMASGTYGTNVTRSLMNSFVFFNGGLALDDAGEKVIAPYTTEEWLEGLKYMNKLYSENLLAASIFTDDDTQFKATLNNESVNIVGSVTAGSNGGIGQIMITTVILMKCKS